MDESGLAVSRLRRRWGKASTVRFEMAGMVEAVLIEGTVSRSNLVSGRDRALLGDVRHEIHHSIHAHPTLSEALGEAALATLGRAIHI